MFNKLNSSTYFRGWSEGYGMGVQGELKSPVEGFQQMEMLELEL